MVLKFAQLPKYGRNFVMTSFSPLLLAFFFGKKLSDWTLRNFRKRRGWVDGVRILEHSKAQLVSSFRHKTSYSRMLYNGNLKLYEEIMELVRLEVEFDRYMKEEGFYKVTEKGYIKSGGPPPSKFRSISDVVVVFLFFFFGSSKLFESSLV